MPIDPFVFLIVGLVVAALIYKRQNGVKIPSAVKRRIKAMQDKQAADEFTDRLVEADERYTVE
ncbi:hypothetical protein [Crateriforma conspicua]|uniref:Uncharacterized protein n=1 Tax=Crateriforma conspicua TaxID=2527996 RepID=A0A5C6FTV3_9PLAN|nr:hypothetical protein [Crateriforma conspicua]TWU66437.1 hypothetical protein V7x_20030 [Crateriforma conspicua]